MAAATRWGCLGPGKIASDFFLAIQDNLPASEHELAPPFHCAVSCSTPSGEYNFPLKPNNYCWTNDAGLHYQVASFRECLLKGLTESPVVPQEVSLLVHQCLSIVAEKIGTFYPGGDDE